MNPIPELFFFASERSAMSTGDSFVPVERLHMGESLGAASKDSSGKRNVIGQVLKSGVLIQRTRASKGGPCGCD